MPLANEMLRVKTNNLKLPVLEIPNQGCMYALWAVGCFPGPYLESSINRKAHLQSNIVNNCSGGGSSSTGMAAVVFIV